MPSGTKKSEEAKSTNERSESPGFLKVIATTFITVFLAELGDKTQIATLLLSAQSGRPVIVFIGAALALICSSLVGVLIGSWLSNTIPAKRFQKMAGILMAGLGVLLGIQATRTIIIQQIIA